MSPDHNHLVWGVLGDAIATVRVRLVVWPPSRTPPDETLIAPSRELTGTTRHHSLP